MSYHAIPIRERSSLELMGIYDRSMSQGGVRTHKHGWHSIELIVTRGHIELRMWKGFAGNSILIEVLEEVVKVLVLVGIE
jgi:hypothetical protein